MEMIAFLNLSAANSVMPSLSNIAVLPIFSKAGVIKPLIKLLASILVQIIWSCVLSEFRAPEGDSADIGKPHAFLLHIHFLMRVF